MRASERKFETRDSKQIQMTKKQKIPNKLVSGFRISDLTVSIHNWMSPMGSTDYAKELAAEKSLDFIEDGMVVGLGTGSTATRFIKLLGERVKSGLKIRAIPSSNTSKELAESLSIPV